MAKVKKISKAKVKALKIAELISDKKAKKIVVLDVSRLSSLCDYFVICTAETGNHAEAISRWVSDKSKENNLEVHHHEKDHSSEWVLVDFFDVMLHIFVDEARKFYDLEHLWADAKRLRISKKKKKD